MISQYTEYYFKAVLLYGFLILAFQVYRDIRNGKLRTSLNKYMLLKSIFLLFVLISIVMNHDKSFVANLKGYAYFIVYFFIIADFDISKNIDALKKEMLQANNIIIILVTTVSLICFTTFLFNISGKMIVYGGTIYEHITLYGIGGNHRLYGIVDNPNTLAIIDVIALICMYVNRKILQHRQSKIMLAAAGINFICFILADSRTAELAALTFIILVLIYNYVQRIKSNGIIKTEIVKLLFSITTVIIAFLLLEPLRLLLGYIPPIISYLLESKKNVPFLVYIQEKYLDVQRDTSEEKPGNGRFILWMAGWRVICHHSLFGVGLMDIQKYLQKYSPGVRIPGITSGLHNLILQLQSCYGIFSTASFLFTLIAAAKDTINLLRSKHLQNRNMLFVIFTFVLILVMASFLEDDLIYVRTVCNGVFLMYLGYLLYFIAKPFPESEIKVQG